MKFRYQKFGLRVFLFVPFFLLLLVISDGLSDYIQSPLLFNLLVVVIVLTVMGLVFKVTEGIPQIRAVGECRIDEQGRCFIVMGRKVTELIDVTDMSAWRKAVVGSRYVQLSLRDRDRRKVRIFGVPLKSGERMADDDLIALQGYILSHYPELKQVTNVYGEPIDYWYKK